MFARSFFLMTLFLAALASAPGLRAAEIVISVKAQTMTVLEGRTRKAEFPISTSKFGLGDAFRSFRTPTGTFAIERKVGDRLPAGAVLKGLHFTGEVLAPDAAGRDPIVTRVLCLRGLDAGNRNAAARGIYIHGTPEEKRIGQPASYGCIRMRSRDVIALFDAVPVGTRVTITDVPPGGLLAAAEKADPHGDDWYR
jgi:lipoprotein-anchoring transpeptidase ErfK/SrfK